LKFIFIAGEESYQLSAIGQTGLSPNSQTGFKGKGQMLGLISLTAPPYSTSKPLFKNNLILL